MARSFASVLRKTGGRAPGLAAVRAVLVFAWIAYQSVRLTGGSAGVVLSPLWIIPFAAIPGLFAMLGFCLAQAATDRGPRDYLLDRLRRARPALLAVVLGSALVIGPVATTGGLRAYLTDPAFAQYFLNLVGWPRFELPGVFEFNDYAEVVNEALWLTPCFAVVVLYALLSVRFFGERRWLAVAGAGATVALYVAGEAAGLIPSPVGSVFRNSFVASGLAAILAGQCGVLAYLWRERLPISGPILLGALGALGAVALLAGPDSVDLPGAPLAIALLAGIAALAAAAQRLPGSWIAGRAAPVLHGALLFSFPLQQFAVDLGPGRQSAAINLGLILPVAVAAAWALQWIVERFGIVRRRTEPEFDQATLPLSLPDLRRPHFWRKLVRQASAGLGIAVAVAAVGLIVILITVAALQSDPVGV